MAKGQRLGGRGKGTPNKRTAEFHAELQQTGMKPLEYMLNVMRSEESNAEQKQWAAAHAAPYCHPKLAPLDRVIKIEIPQTDTAEAVGKALSVVTGIGISSVRRSAMSSLRSEHTTMHDNLPSHWSHHALSDCFASASEGTNSIIRRASSS